MSKPTHPSTAHDAVVLKGQRRKSAPWSEEEDEILRLAYATGGANEAIAALGSARTPAAIRLRASQKKLPKRNWSESEKREVLQLVKEGLSIEQISSQLGRSGSAIRQKIKGMAFESKAALKRPRPSRPGPLANTSKAQPLPTKPRTHRQPTRYTTERMKLTLSEAGGEFLEGDVVTGKSPVRARCRCGECVTKMAQDWDRTPDGCKSCRGQKLSTSLSWARLEYAADLAKVRGCELPAQASPRQITSRVHWRCVLGHAWEAPINLIANGQWCPQCRPLLTEGMVRSVVEGALGKPFHKVRPPFLDGLELDGFNEELGLAFEYDGEFHDDDKQRVRDVRKRRLCELNDIRLIEVNHHDGALGPVGVQRAVERELQRLGVQPQRSVWDVPVEISSTPAQLEHRRRFVEALAARGFTWDPDEWVDVDTKVHVYPPGGASPVLAIPRTFIAGRMPAQLASNAKLDHERIKDRVARRGWTLCDSSNYQNAHTTLDFIDPQGKRRPMNWNKWQERVEKRSVFESSCEQLTLAFQPCN